MLRALVVLQVEGIKVRRKLRADEIAEVFDPVDIGQCGCDERTCHDAPFLDWPSCNAVYVKGPAGD